MPDTLYILITALPMLVCLFWAVFSLCRFAGRLDKESTGAAEAVPMLFFMTSTVLYSCHFLYFEGLESRWIEVLYIIANLSVFPLFRLYLLQLVHSDKRRGMATFVPAMAAGLLLALCIVLGQDKAYLVIRIAARLCFAVQVLFVWISGSIMLRDFRSQLDNIYSDDRSWELRPVTIMLNLLGVISVIAILLNLVGKEWFAGKWIVAAPALMMSVLLYALGYVMSEIRVVIEDIQEQDIDEPLAPVGYDDVKPLAGDGTEADYVVALKNRLETYMDSKPYSDPAFTIYDLARALGSNRSYISNFINHHYGMNFAAFVAHYRVENAKTILADRSFLTHKEALNAAMRNSGFISEPTFYRLFKQQTGTTPREYRINSLASSAD